MRRVWPPLWTTEALPLLPPPKTANRMSGRERYFLDFGNSVDGGGGFLDKDGGRSISADGILSDWGGGRMSAGTEYGQAQERNQPHPGGKLP